MRRKISLGLSAAAVAWGALADSAHAGGFELRAFDAKATGMSQAFTAIADNASAANYNPAAMSQLDGIQASLTATYIKPVIHFTPDNPAEGESNNYKAGSLAPSLAATIQAHDYVHFGIGVNAPFGTNVEWRDGWSGRYIATHTRIQSLQLSPSVSFLMPFMPEGNTLAFSGGIGVVTTDVFLKQAIDFSSSGAPDAFARLEGNTNNHLRVVWQVSGYATLMDRMIGLGFQFRSATQNNVIHGNAEFYNQPINPITQQPALPSVSKARAELNFPDTLKTGVAVRPIDDLTLSAEFTWTNWSRLRDVRIQLIDINQLSIIPLNWRDTYYYSLGAEYAAIPEMLFVRAGIYYDESPTRADTVSPSIPDNHRKGFSVGIGFNPTESVQLDFAYAAVFLNALHKGNDIGKDDVLGGNPRAVGDFDTYAHVFVFSIGFWF
jgi:long-chain fatty acid transport protein